MAFGPRAQQTGLSRLRTGAIYEREKDEGGERDKSEAIKPSPSRLFPVSVFITESRCSGLIFMGHCSQAFGGASMFDLISDTSASIGMFQKGTFLNQHRFQPGQVVTCATEKTDNAVRMFQPCDQTYGLMLAEPTSYRLVISGDRRSPF